MISQVTGHFVHACFWVLPAVLLLFLTLQTGMAEDGAGESILPMSERFVKITSNGQEAVFQLYDTVGAREFYEQLPLELDLSNFRDAQWMFYPPEKLGVTTAEAYHDGKKGELSYYAPWGDVFMLYEDFYAGDEMHRLGVGVSGVDRVAHMSGAVAIEKDKTRKKGKSKNMEIQVITDGGSIVYELNDSVASRELYSQLPLETEVEDYGGKEKIFYPPKKLATSKTPKANAVAGTLAYYAPWGDVVMFYKNFGSAAGLFELGKAVSGSDSIKSLSGTVKIIKNEE